MMKHIKILASVLAVIIYSLPLSAKDNEERLYDLNAPTKLIEVNPFIGVGISSVLQNYSSVIPGLSDFLLSPGFALDGGVDVKININNAIGIGTGLNFGICNADFAMNLLENSTGSISSIFMRNHYYQLQVPVYVSVSLNLRRKLKWIIEGGGYYSHGLGGKMKASGYTSGMNSLGQPTVTHAYYEQDYFDNKSPIINGVKNTDFGIHIGTGFVYNVHYTLKAVLETGIPNLAINHGVLDVKYRNISLLWKFGYIF